MTPPQGTGLLGEYFDNKDLTLLLFTRTDATINFNWGTGAPRAGMGTETFSERWTGQVVPLYSETYTFYTLSDDGVRLWVNGQQLVNNWTLHAPVENSGAISLVAGQAYDIRLEHYEDGGGAQIQLQWSSASQPKQVIPQSQLVPASAQMAALAARSAAIAVETETPTPAVALSATLALEQMMLPSATPTSTDAEALTVPTETPPAETIFSPTFTPTETATPLLAVAAPTMTPTATPTLLPGEIVIGVELCEAQADGAAGLLVGEQLPIGINGGLPWTTGFRFCGATLPPAARIVSAWMELTSLENASLPLTVDVALEETANSPLFQNGAPPSLRMPVNLLSWEMQPWVVGSRYRTPDLASLLLPIVGRVDWQPGYALTVLVRGRAGDASRMVSARPLDAQLFIRYIVDVTPTEALPTATDSLPTALPTETWTDAPMETPTETATEVALPILTPPATLGSPPEVTAEATPLPT